MFEKAKNKLKKTALTSVILTAGLAGSSHAAAARVSTDDRDPQEAVYDTNSHKSFDVPVFYQDKPLNINVEDFLKAAENAGADKSQKIYLNKRLNVLLKSPQGITENNFKWMLSIAVNDKKINPQTAESLQQKFMNEALKKSDVRYAKNQYSSLTYEFRDDGLFFEGNISINANSLLPVITKKADDYYHCGPSKSSNYTIAKTMETEAIKRLVMQNAVYEDLQKRIKSGESLGLPEKQFMKKHPLVMERHGLFTDATGKLKQKNPPASKMSLLGLER